MRTTNFFYARGGRSVSAAVAAVVWLSTQTSFAQTPTPAAPPAVVPPRAGATNQPAPVPTPAAQPAPPTAPAGTVKPSPGAAAAPPSMAPATAQPAAAEAQGKPADVQIPVSAVTLAVEKKLATMLKGDGLTSKQVASRALTNSKQLIAKRREVEAASAGVDKANAAYIPSLKLAARYTRLSDIDAPQISFGNQSLVFSQNQAQPGQVQLNELSAFPLSFGIPVAVNQYALTATLDIPLSDYVLRVSHGVDAAKNGQAAATLNERALRLAVSRDAQVAYYEWIRAQGAEFVADQAVTQANGHLADAEHGFTAGILSRADVLRAKGGVKNAELFQQRTRSAVAVTTEQLRVIQGDEPGTKYEVGENILQAPTQAVTDDAAAVAEARNKRVELQAIDASIASLRSQSSLAHAANYPRLDAQGRAQYSNPNERYFFPDGDFHGTWDVSVVLSWTPTDLIGASATNSELVAKTQALEAQRNDLHDALRLEVTNSLEAFKTASFSVVATKEQLAAVEESYRARTELFRAGRATGVEVTDAETEVTRARLEVVNAYVDLHIAGAQLRHAVGRDH
jgi:outer membrane protein